MIHRLPAEQVLQQAQGLVEEPSSGDGRGGLPERAELVPAILTQPDANREPPPGEPIEGGDLAGQYPGPAAGQRSDHGSEPDRAGGGRDPRHGYPGVGNRPAHTGQDVVPKEEALPTRLLRGHGELHDPPGIGELVEGGQE